MFPNISSFSEVATSGWNLDKCFAATAAASPFFTPASKLFLARIQKLPPNCRRRSKPKEYYSCSTPPPLASKTTTILSPYLSNPPHPLQPPPPPTSLPPP